MPTTSLHRQSRLNTYVGIASSAVLAFTSFVGQAHASTVDVFGRINAPAGVDKYNAQAVGAGGIGLMLFVSNLISLSTIIAGIWVFINFIMAGWIYITSSGDSAAHKKVGEKLTMSVMGIVIIVAAYTITALISLIVFGDAKYILSPTLKGIQ
jgi:hypothetical protein